MRKNKYVNKALYEKRLALGLSLNEAGRLLHIYIWTLRLIEKGYWTVSKKLQKRFIQAYKLDEDFFDKCIPIGVPIEKPIKGKPKVSKSWILKKWFRWVTVGTTVATAAVTGFGIYCLNRKEIHPTAKWSDDFKAFHKAMLEQGEQKISVLYPGDTKYTVSVSEVVSTNLLTSSISTFGQASHAVDTNINSELAFGQDSPIYDFVKANSIINFDFLIYNKKKIVYSSFNDSLTATPKYTVTYAAGVLDNEGNISYRPFTYYDQDGIAKVADIGSEVYNKFSSAFNYYSKTSSAHINNVLTTYDLRYKDVNKLVADIQIISRDIVFYLRMGIWFTAIFASLAVIALFLMATHFYVYYKHKKKEKIGQKPQAYTIEEIALFANTKFNKVSKIRLFVPEFVMKIIAYTIALLSSIATIMIVYTMFEGTFWSYLDSLKAKNFTSNFLITGITLLFFITLDNYTQKKPNEIFKSIVKFLILGIILYIFELTIFYAFSTRGNIFSRFLANVSNLLPGNFFWPLGLYALLYFLLFVTPNKIAHDEKKIMKFRALAAIPTTLLVFNLIWQFAIKPYAGDVPFYINFLFYSKSAVLIIFLLVYIYGLFIYRMFVCKKYKINFNNSIYFYTKRYYSIKNSIACLAIVGITLFDLMFRFLKPDNSYGFGNNWALALTIPFIFFYQPHIGKRNKAWDLTCSVLLNPLTAFGGIIGATIEVAAFLNMENLFFIIT